MGTNVMFAPMQISFQMAEYVNVKNYGNSNLRRVVFLTIIYFFYIYSFQVPGLSYGATFYRVALVGLFLYACISSNMKAVTFGVSRTSNMVKKYLWWNVFLFFYVGLILLNYGRGDGLSALPFYVNMLIVLPLFFISGKYIFRNTEEVLTILYACSIIQAIIIVIATMAPSLQIILKTIYLGSSSNLEDLERVDNMLAGGYNIGFQCLTSQGCLQMSMGLIGCCYYLMKTKDSKFLVHVFLFGFITFASSLLARTGFFISILCLIMVLNNKMKSGAKGFLSSIFLLFLLLFVFNYILDNFTSNQYLNESFRRFSTIFSGGIEAYFLEWRGEGVGENVVPPLSYNTLLGLGIRGGTSGVGIRAKVDGGFLVNYISMGLIMSIINYIMVLSFIIKNYKRTYNNHYKSLSLIMLIVLIMGEVKEQFIYQMYFMCFMFVIFYLMEREEATRQKIS